MNTQNKDKKNPQKTEIVCHISGKFPQCKPIKCMSFSLPAILTRKTQ